MTRAEWNEIYAVNLTSVSIACQTVGKRMLERQRGHIINIASETSLQAFPYVAAYGASKGGVRSLTAHLATEWARFGLCVNAIAPGLFLTALNRPIMQQDPQRLEKILQATPALRLGDEKFEDLRAATIFLTTCSNYVNGQLIAVDGGMSVAAFT
jgi:NAD(P)-dependent dehydrogenase (short-subunit alcohol dehydrogenase family)